MTVEREAQTGNDDTGGEGDVESNADNANENAAAATTINTNTNRRRNQDNDQFTSVDLVSYCRGLQKRPIDVIIDELDPKKIPVDAVESRKVFLRLESDVDEVVSDDILGLNPVELNYLSSITGEYRTNKIVRRLGRSYYLAIDARRKLMYQNLMKLNWEEGTSILDFNYSIQKSVDSCVELGILQQTVDQILIYLSKVNYQRAENPILFTAN